MNDSEQDMKYCPHCGTEIERKASFCFACGAQLEEGAAVIPEKVSPAPGVGYPANRIEQKMDQISVKLAEKTEKITVKLAEKREKMEVKIAQKKELRATKKEKKKAKKSFRKGLIAGIIISCIVVSIGAFFVVGLVTYGSYQETYTYYYNPASPASIEECAIYADTAFITVQYNSTPVSYYAKVDVSFDFRGLFVSGKTYRNLFNIISWENDTSAALSLTRNPVSWIDPTNWFKTEWNIITLTLRTDVVYDITATSITGGISVTVPENVSVNDLSLLCTTGSVSVYGTDANFTQGLSSGTTTGNTLLNFSRCTFGDNIAGTSTTGSVTFNTYNAEYTQANTLTLSTTTGNIYTRIDQHSIMGASVTGSVTTTTGNIAAYYYDNSADVGAKFRGSTSTGSVSCSAIKINEVIDPISKNMVCTSTDFIGATYTYDLTLGTTTGNVHLGGENTD